MKNVRLTQHALQQCIERGTDSIEVTLAVNHGSREPAKQGRLFCRYNFPFNGLWQGKYYAIKQVAPVIKVESQEIVVITVYTYFF